MNQTTQTGKNTTRRQHTPDSGYQGYDRPHEEDSLLRVQTRVLDKILTEENVGQVDIIKIDVEGTEYLVMQVDRRCIARDKPFIVFEIGLGGSDLYGTRPAWDICLSRQPAASVPARQSAGQK